MRHELRSLQERIGTTTVYVTHDQEEALGLSDRIALMRDGRIVEIGEPMRLYLRPQHAFTAEFIGHADAWPCEVKGREGDVTYVSTFLGTVASRAAADVPGGEARVYIRPEHVLLRDAGAETATGLGANEFLGTVTKVSFTGRMVEYDVRVAGRTVRVHAVALELHEPGDQVIVRLPPERCVVLAADEGA